MQIELDEKEVNFLMSAFSQMNINPLNPAAAEMVAVIQQISGKLKPQPKGE